MTKNKALLNEIKKQPCLCAPGCFGPVDPCHIKTVKSGGPDTEWNVMPMCRKHHQEQHQMGIKHMVNNYDRFFKFLINHGWEYSALKDKWIHTS